ncbi:MAG TPA: thioesterase domain-containing protein [Stellaceae bacterium]|nr:thioesterase domain-containing protein [Stellaceae bacterium]
MSERLTQQDTAQLFRSVHAARSWAQKGIGALESAQIPGCVTLKSGSGGPPVFMLPGAAGSILQIAPLATAMTVPEPVYAIKPRGMELGETPCEDLAEMARHAINTMRRVWPAGPYLLIGYSAGGLVALEVARQLAAAGAAVPLVILLDTYPSHEIWPFLCHVEIIARQSMRALRTICRMGPRAAAADIMRRLRSLLLYLAASGIKLVAPPPIIAEGSDAASRRVHLATYNAGEAYRPSRYDGSVVFVQPEFIPNLEPRSPRRVWGQFLSNLTVRQVRGSHLGMLDESAVAAAAEISRCLDEARG